VNWDLLEVWRATPRPPAGPFAAARPLLNAITDAGLGVLVTGDIRL
jgi:hypothetical protein